MLESFYESIIHKKNKNTLAIISPEKFPVKIKKPELLRAFLNKLILSQII